MLGDAIKDVAGEGAYEARVVGSLLDLVGSTTQAGKAVDDDTTNDGGHDLHDCHGETRKTRDGGLQ